ncbi:MAG: dihydrofolate reductase [Hyphomicrobiales bacterium]|nr:dihydrofolate reductase [Hyphomicrobiales bacterium]
MTEPIIAFVVAVSENGVIGRDGALPWRLKSELRMFRRLTMGKPVVMGRKTFQSLPGVLDGRTNIVITRSGFTAPGVLAAASLEDSLRLAREAPGGAEEIFVIGGAQIFAAAEPYASRLYLTRVHAVVDGDVFLPGPDPAEWRETSRRPVERGAGDDFDYTALVYERVR